MLKVDVTRAKRKCHCCYQSLTRNEVCIVETAQYPNSKKYSYHIGCVEEVVAQAKESEAYRNKGVVEEPLSFPAGMPKEG